MIRALRPYAPHALKAVVALAFLAAGLSKLAGAGTMVATFEAIGLGQWFRVVTGAIEVGGSVLLFVPGAQAAAAAVLMATMAGAVLAHVAVLGPSAVPALVLGALFALILWHHRDQATRLVRR